MNEILETRFQPDYVVTPGETLLEVLEDSGMSQAELAERTGRPKKTINGIVQGKVAITAETALQLERVLGIAASFWNNLQRQYDESLARLNEDERMQTRTDWLANFPVAKMRGYGWLPCFDDPISQLDALLKFFGIASPDQWTTVWEPVLRGIPFRKSHAHESTPEVVAVWLRQGEIEAQQIACEGYDAARFKEVLRQVRALTATPIQMAWPETIRLCAVAGVAVVAVQELPGAPVSGAARWLSPTKAMLQVSLRYKTDDQLWFSFFHEAAHILLHGKRATFVDFDDPEGAEKQEVEADAHAAEFLIPGRALRAFLQANPPPYIGRAAIEAFAAELGIAPGIVVGRLQHDAKLLKRNCNDLKVRLTWAEARQAASDAA